jgi:CPA2 family monovalent cation:H+ antiporter-2
LAGVVLANSEYKHELESDLEPFKGLLLGLFFIGVGASVNFELIANNPVTLFSYVLIIIALKALVLAILGKYYGLKTSENLLFALVMSQVGEFAFVLFSFIGQLSILNKTQIDLMMAVVAVSMTMTPLLLLLNDKVIQPALKAPATEAKPHDVIEEQKGVIIAGFSHFGSTVGRFLRANGIEATILDNDPDIVDLLRKMGFKVYYGDATRVELLESAGIEKASLFISAIGSPEVNEELVHVLKKHFPHVEMMIRSRNRFTAYGLMSLGVDEVYRETLDTSVRMGVEVLHKLGLRRYAAYRAGQNFLKYDQEAMTQLFDLRHDKKEYIKGVRDQIAQQEQLLQNDQQAKPHVNDHAWDSEHMRNAINKPGEK